VTQAPTAPADAGQANGLAIAGFVVSLLGLVGTGGFLCPIGLILSLVALGRGGSGRGFAIAGIILGALGTCGGLLVLVFAGSLILAALGLGVAAIALAEPERIELTADMIALAVAVSDYKSEHRYLPADLSDLDAEAPLLIDPWGNPYEYRLTTDKRGFDLVSHGEDGLSGTDDDILLSRLGDAWTGNISVKTSTGAAGGTVSVTVGDRTLELTGDDDGGVVAIDMGDQILQIKGDDDGGTIEVIDKEKDEGTESLPVDADDEPPPTTAPPE
jgi:hypothetical protein